MTQIFPEAPLSGFQLLSPSLFPSTLPSFKETNVKIQVTWR